MSEAHEAAYQASILRPESFWAAAAEGIEWTRRWDSVLDRGAAPAPRWFAGASLSTCHNAVDRHVLTGRGGATAVIRALVVERLPKMRSGITLGSAVRRIADGVDFAVPEGQVTMLLGRNGAGKTTTLRTIMGLWPASAGELRFMGRSIKGQATPDIATQGIAYVPESMGIFSDLTVKDNMV
ncbi:MAG: acetyl-coenzyme A synthetase N-terminal domain-containing protein, partial [Actinomycetes bacterium]